MTDWMPSLAAWQGRTIPLAPMMWVTSFATAVVILKKNGILFDDIAVPSTILTLTGTALFFLLVFRTNSSYSRWWEGRIKWGGTINRTRDLVRQAVLYVEHDDLVERICKYTIAFPYCMKNHLRFEHHVKGLDAVATPVRLSDAELAQILEADHMPLYVCDVLGQALLLARKEGNLGEYHACMLDENIRYFEDMLGACERILKTPFPWSYLVHLRTFMMLWLLMLPVVIVEDYGYYTIPAVFVTAYGIMGIEQIGVQIENPFGYDYSDLQMEAFCKTIESNCAEILKRHRANTLGKSGLKNSTPISGGSALGPLVLAARHTGPASVHPAA
jgi:putative membrane protein